MKRRKAQGVKGKRRQHKPKTRRKPKTHTMRAGTARRHAPREPAALEPAALPAEATIPRDLSVITDADRKAPKKKNAFERLDRFTKELLWFYLNPPRSAA
jgi:hypothetical protein